MQCAGEDLVKLQAIAFVRDAVGAAYLPDPGVSQATQSVTDEQGMRNGDAA